MWRSIQELQITHWLAVFESYWELVCLLSFIPGKTSCELSNAQTHLAAQMWRNIVSVGKCHKEAGWTKLLLSLTPLIPFTLTELWAAFDTNKPAGICSISLKTPVSEPPEDFVDFHSLPSCLIKCTAVMGCSSSPSEFHGKRDTLCVFLEFYPSQLMSPPVETIFTMYVAYARYSRRYTANNFAHQSAFHCHQSWQSICTDNLLEREEAAVEAHIWTSSMLACQLIKGKCSGGICRKGSQSDQSYHCWITFKIWGKTAP